MQITEHLLAAFLVSSCLLSAQISDETVRRVQTLIQQGNFTAACAQLDAAIEAHPRDAGLYNLQGVVQAQQADTVGAERSFKRAIELSPHFSGPYLNLGHLYEQTSKANPNARAQALEIYDRLLKFQPGDAEANFQAALLLFQQGSFESSREHLSRLPPEDQSRATTLAILCGDFAGQGNDGEAKESAQRLLRSPDLTEANALSILPLLAQARNWELTIGLVEGLRAKGLAGFNSLEALANAYKELGKLEAARSTLEQAQRLHPQSVPILMKLAYIAHDQHDNVAALGFLAHARDLDPQNAGVHFFWGVVCMEQNLTEEAYRALKKAVSLDPGNAYFNYAAGVATIEHGDARESLPYFQKYCELHPREARGRLALGVAYFSTGDDQNAGSLLSSVARFPETAAPAYYYLGRIANRKGDYPAAIRELKLALQSSPNYADAYAELGLIFVKQREFEQAEHTLRKALELNPDSYTANLNLLHLYQQLKDPRVEAQAKRFNEVKQKRAKQNEESFWGIEARPQYSDK